MIFLPTAGESLELCSRKDAAGHIPYARRGTVITEGSLASSSRYSLRRGEPRPEKCAMPRPPVCLTPHGGNLEKSRVRPERAMPGLYPGLCPAFPGRPAPGKGGVLLLPLRPWRATYCFCTGQSMFFSGTPSCHGMPGEKSDVKRKSPYDVSS